MSCCWRNVATIRRKLSASLGAGFPDLPRIENKILAKNRKLDAFARVAEIL